MRCEKYFNKTDPSRWSLPGFCSFYDMGVQDGRLLFIAELNKRRNGPHKERAIALIKSMKTAKVAVAPQVTFITKKCRIRNQNTNNAARDLRISNTLAEPYTPTPKRQRNDETEENAPLKLRKIVAQADKNTLKSQGIFCRNFPASIEAEIPLMINTAEATRNKMLEESEVMKILRSMPPGNFYDALAKFKMGGVTAVMDALSLDGRFQSNMFEIFLYMSRSFEKWTKLRSVTDTLGERTLDREAWSPLYDLAETEETLVHYGETFSTSDAMTGVEVHLGESMGTATAGALDSKLRKTLRSAQALAANVYVRTGREVGVPVCIFFPKRAILLDVVVIGQSDHVVVTFVTRISRITFWLPTRKH
ncbi:hypothetical protein DFS34DRAFT_369268 [Phlyctochytrium arcticum]|nr:hypothetical protein DFS34DRAFT_369268 [Phlyctochytrium arcticum]